MSDIDISKIVKEYDLAEKYRKEFDLAEKHRNLLQVVDPFAKLREQYSALDAHRNANMLSTYQEDCNRIHSRFNNIKSASELLSSTYNQFMLDFQKDINVVNTVFRDISDSYKTVADDFTRRYQDMFSLEKACRTAYDAYKDAYILPTQRLLESITNAATIAKISLSNDFAINLMLQGSIAYQDFARKQLKHLVYDQPIIAERRIQITDTLGTIYESNEATLSLYSDYIAGDEFSDSDVIISPSIYNSINSHVGYVYNPRNSVDVEIAVDKAMPTRINQTGCRMIELVYMINDVSKKRSNLDVFTPTNKCIKACYKIPNVMATSEICFADIIDQLFFMLYEGSGGSSNRLVGLVGDINLLEPLWKVKALRLEFRHDIEHGHRNEIDKKYLNIGNTYRELIGYERPRSSRDWLTAQHNLYIMLSDMLDIVHSKQYAVS